MKQDQLFESKLHELAKFLLFSSSTVTSEILHAKLQELSLQFRTCKSIPDVSHAIKKMHKQKTFKTEFEISMLEVYLRQVFKLTKQEDKLAA